MIEPDNEKPVRMRVVTKIVKSGKNPEGTQMFKKVKVREPVVDEGQTPPEPMGPNAQRTSSGPLNPDANDSWKDWTD